MDVVTHIVKYNAQTNGRDKLCRLFQYASKLTWWNLDRLNKDPSLITKLKNLETNLSATRKVLRLGKSLDMLQGALKSFSLQDIAHRLTLTLSKLNQACYLLADHFIWAGKLGLMRTDTKKLGRVSAHFWLVSIICNLIRNAYDLLNLLRLHAFSTANVESSTFNGTVTHKRRSSDTTATAGRFLVNNKPMVADIVKNCSDLLLPLSALGYINTSAGVQGVAGMIGSFIGMLIVWNPSLKQSPA